MIRPIVKGPDPILNTVCTRFDPANPDHMQAVTDLIDTIRDTPRAFGLAAPQIGSAVRAFAMRLPETIAVYTNPVITWASGVNVVIAEECMSFPWLGPVKVARPRPGSIMMQFDKFDGGTAEINLSGMEARVALHEIDHLNGITVDTIRRKK